MNSSGQSRYYLGSKGSHCNTKTVNTQRQMASVFASLSCNSLERAGWTAEGWEVRVPGLNTCESRPTAPCVNTAKLTGSKEEPKRWSFCLKNQRQRPFLSLPFYSVT